MALQVMTGKGFLSAVVWFSMNLFAPASELSNLL